MFVVVKNENDRGKIFNFDWEDRKPMIQLTNHYGCGFFSKPLAGHPSSILKKNSFIQKTYETMGF